MVQETFDEWLKRQEDATDKRRKQYRIWESLLVGLKTAAHDRQELEIKYRASVEAATGQGSGWVGAAKKRAGRNQWSAWNDFERVSACQSEWRGFAPSCCDGRAVAVPIGCNHRLCPLCNAHRAEHYRDRVKALFAQPCDMKTGEVRNWQLLTLTVPNVHRLTKLTISTLRKRLRAFLRDHNMLIKGGVYSIEITRTAAAKGWHPHIHCLVDVEGEPGNLPYAEFMERKWRLEFEWYVLTQGKREGERRWKDADFAEWVAPLDPRNIGRPLSPANVKWLAGRREGERRSVDIRPVSTEKKAAYEVMKYMTKVAFFVDDPKALAEFLTAVKGVRAIQTFGNCYGFKLDDAPVESTLPACPCGKNEYGPIGTLGLGMVALSPEGRWWVRDDAPVHGRHCRGGTTIRGH